MYSSDNLSEILKSEILKYNSICILGFGREGKSTYSLIRKYLPEQKLIIADKNQTAFSEHPAYSDNYTEKHSGVNYLDCLKHSELVFVSPGISLFQVTIPEKTHLTSQTDFLFRFFGKKIVAVTGTKGKSTTSSLIAHILRTQFDHVPLAGNIGIPPFDLIDDIVLAETAVVEVSSHQLQYITAAPRIGIILNLFPEHLDYYPDTETYYNAKRNLFRLASDDDCIIINLDQKNIYPEAHHINAKKLFYSVHPHAYKGAWAENGSIYCNYHGTEQIIKFSELNISGLHNISNCLAAICACSHLGLTTENMYKGLRTFHGLPHRMERIETPSGIICYNDSIATIPQASLFTVETLQPVASLILGGKDRGLDYSDFYEKIIQYKINNIFCYGEAGQKMFDVLKNKIPRQIFYHSDFSECALHALRSTLSGQICLLSPAASSYDQFKNFEERGEVFRVLSTSFQ